jgi:TolB-like protein/DNA-binding winged helix-turn-helix (wHTH) protein/Tfp pilus assembly protein PilF
MAIPERPSVIRFGVYEFSAVTRELRKNGMRIRLEGQPLTILEVLLERPGELVSREVLRNRLWPGETFVDFDHSLNAGVKRLRATLSDSAEHPRYIETQARRGYRFIAAVDRADTGSRPSDHPPPSSVEPRRGGVTARRWGLLATMAFCMVGLLGWRAHRWLHLSPAPDHPAIHSLAVLPLKNLSGDSTQDYFADGITEELIGRLSPIRGLRVISRTSVAQFKDTKLLAPEIARKLGVDALVEGSVIREGNRVRVHAQLIRASTDEHFWSQTYDRQLDDALSLESEVAQAIANKIEVTATGEEHARLVAPRPVSPDVYESYLKGLAGKGTSRADVEASIANFDEAIRSDPTFAPAYVGLANAYDRLDSILVGGASPIEMRPKVISAAQKALELDSQLSEAHVILGHSYMSQWRWAEAEAEFTRALDLNPNDPRAHEGMSDRLLGQGRFDEALAWARRERELDPLGASGEPVGWVLFCARRYKDAIQESRNELVIKPGDGPTLWNLGWMLIFNNQVDEAIPVLEKAVSVTDRSPGVISALVWAYVRGGRRADALQLLEELKRRKRAGYIPAAAMVNSYLALGDKDEAFAWFELACREHSNLLKFIKVFPPFDPVRGDPRFQDLIRRVGLG